MGVLTSGKVPLEKTLIKRAEVSKRHGAQGGYAVMRVGKEIVT